MSAISILTLDFHRRSSIHYGEARTATGRCYNFGYRGAKLVWVDREAPYMPGYRLWLKMRRPPNGLRVAIEKAIRRAPLSRRPHKEEAQA